MFISWIKVSWAGFEICFMFAFSGLYIYEEAYCFCVYVKWVYIALFLPFYFSQITCPSVLQPGQSSSEFIGELLVVFFNWCKFIVGWYWVFLIEVCYSLTSWYRQFWLVNLQSFIPMFLNEFTRALLWVCGSLIYFLLGYLQVLFRKVLEEFLVLSCYVFWFSSFMRSNETQNEACGNTGPFPIS